MKKKELGTQVSLTDLANKYRTDKGTLGPGYHGFTTFYETYLDNIKNDVQRVLEIGVGGGSDVASPAASLKMWKEYFPNATIFGADNTDYFNLAEPRIEIYYCDQSDRASLNDLVQKTGGSFDLIIDDGGHNTIHQQTTLGVLFKHLVADGIYILEDLHTSVWGNWGLPAMDENCAYCVLKRIENNRNATSKYFTETEKIYLEEYIEFCSLFDLDKDHITSIIKKKK